MRPEDDNERRSLNRREFLIGASALAASVGIGADPERARGAVPLASSEVPIVALGGQPTGLPIRQHAWTETLRVDDVGNPIAPRFDRLLFFDVKGRPTASVRAATGGGAADARASLPLGPVGPAVHRRLGARVLRARARRQLPDSRGDRPVELRVAGDRRLPPVPALRMRRRAKARRGGGGAAARRASGRC